MSARATFRRDVSRFLGDENSSRASQSSAKSATNGPPPSKNILKSGCCSIPAKQTDATTKLKIDPRIFWSNRRKRMFEILNLLCSL